MYALHDHACSISESPNGGMISLNEAHYICAIVNSELVEKYILNSSDSRSFKADMPINII
jgi:hypothetical protein